MSQGLSLLLVWSIILSTSCLETKVEVVVIFFYKYKAPMLYCVLDYLFELWFGRKGKLRIALRTAAGQDNLKGSNILPVQYLSNCNMYMGSSSI